MLASPIARPRAAGAASLTSVNDETNPYSNPVRKTAETGDRQRREAPERAISDQAAPETAGRPRPIGGRRNGRRTGRRRSTTSVRARRTWPPQSEAAGRHAVGLVQPDARDDEDAEPVAAIAADASIGGHADRGSGTRSFGADRAGDPGATRRADVRAPRPPTDQPGRHTGRASRTAGSTAPASVRRRGTRAPTTSRTSRSHDSRRERTRWPIQAWPATVRLPTPSTSRGTRRRIRRHRPAERDRRRGGDRPPGRDRTPSARGRGRGTARSRRGQPAELGHPHDPGQRPRRRSEGALEGGQERCRPNAAPCWRPLWLPSTRPAGVAASGWGRPRRRRSDWRAARSPR